ncbi:EAL domain-containing protein [Jatrophihabitans sp.]|uniref:EAL domain-containing protein n=1 Tax=Jatrophihabitans sp. TaxID=1932789 RepID=UPI0030C6AECA|nr:conserved hypothetical signaling protein [Jatrophihabitans sp.]
MSPADELFQRRAFLTALRTGVALPGPLLRRLLLTVGLTELLLLGGGLTLLVVTSDRDAGIAEIGAVIGAVLAVLLVQAIALRIVLRPTREEQRRRLYIRAKIENVLFAGSLRMAFQPIFRASDGVQVGVEALARFRDPVCSDTERWFEAAAEVGLTQELEMLAVRSALDEAAQLPAPLYLALNVSPSTFISAALRRTLLTGSFPTARVVLELTEHDAIPDYVPVMVCRDLFRAEGITVAIDDTGAGFSSMRHVVTLAPDVVKIDRSLVTKIDVDATQQAMVAAVVAFAHTVGITVVAEGVETTAQLLQLTQLGVDEVQGYLLGPPQRAAEATAPEALLA